MGPEEVLKSIEAEAPRLHLPIIGPLRGRFLDETVEEHTPSKILEIGTLVGYSAIRMARHLRPGQKLTCVEVNGDMVKTAKKNIESAGLSDRVEVLHGDAKKVLKTLSGPFDMVFLDAAKDEYLTYLHLCEPMLHQGSVVVADNVKSHPREVAGYLEYVRNGGKFKSVYRESADNFRYGKGVIEPDAVEVSIRL